MISLDRNSEMPLYQQIANGIRYQIVVGRYPVGRTIPSSRQLASELDVSFHTVQKAYRKLEEAGIIALAGRGYQVSEIVSQESNEKIEQGASIVKNALSMLISLGFSSEEIEYLIDEQLSLVEQARSTFKCILVGTALELLEGAKKQIEEAIRRPVEIAVAETLWRHPDADHIIVPHTLIRRIGRDYSRASTTAVTSYLSPSTMAHIGTLGDLDTLGIVTFAPESIPDLTRRIRAQAGFTGQILGASVEGSDNTHLQQFVASVDAIVHTRPARRRLLPFITNKPSHLIEDVIAPDSLMSVIDSVPID